MKCKIENRCGNCQLLKLNYDETINYKIESLKKCFFKNNIKHNIDEVIIAEDNFHYRNKMIVSFKYFNNQVIAGFYQVKSHKVIAIDNCLMHSELQNKIVVDTVNIIKQLKIKVYDEDRRSGLIRHLLLRESHINKDIMMVIVTSEEMFPGRSEFVKRIKNLNPNIKTIIQNINPRKTSIVLGEKEKVLLGNGYIEDVICNLKFRLTSKSFFQINPKQTERLYYKVLEYASFQGNEVVLDAYSGVSTIGQILSKYVKEVITVENNSQAVIAAKQNAKENGINNITIIKQDATYFINELVKEKEKVDVIILDPARDGTTISFIEAATKLKPNKIIYVSCDMNTLARDLKEFVLRGYVIKKVCAVDMFCWTDDIETVVLMSRNI